MTQVRYLEDFTIGEAWESAPVVVTAEEIIAYAQVNDPQPMHIDPDAPRRARSAA